MVDAAGATLALLTRAPSSGGKSRLFRSLDTPPGPALLRALLLDTLDATRLAGVHRVIAVTPASACGEVRTLAPDAEVMPQADGDLGARMRAAMGGLLRRGAAAVALIGSDVPHVSAAELAEAFDVLARERNALVLGPATDGGYYLIGASRVPDVFAGIEWGSDRVLTDTIRAAEADGFRVHRLAPLADVDTANDLRGVVAGGRAPRTADWVRIHVPHLLDEGETM